VLTAADWRERDTLVVDFLRAGKVGILPTDTIYGLSANAFDARATRRLLALKRRNSPPTLVPHDLEWARGLVDERDLAAFDEAYESRTGALTLLARRRPGTVGPDCWVDNPDVGFRFPDSAISEWARALGAPIVSTSVNVTGGRPMTALDDCDPQVWSGVDFAVLEGALRRNPSALLWLNRTPWALQPRTLEPA